MLDGTSTCQKKQLKKNKIRRGGGEAAKLSQDFFKVFLKNRSIFTSKSIDPDLSSDF